MCSTPSGPVTLGELAGITLAFLPRHGEGHALPPGHVPYQANIAALKQLGVTDILSVSACGSLKEAHAPGDFVFVDQYVDRTQGRPRSFFGPGLVAHVPMARPVCSRLAGLAADAAQTAGAKVARGGGYIAIEGPQFSTRAESELYRAAGLDVIGMTAMPEARLAREAELPYATCAMVTDYDCWHAEAGEVDVASVIKVMQANVGKARAMIAALAQTLSAAPRTPSPDGIETVLDAALITAPSARNADLVKRLDVIAGRVLA